MNGKDNLCSRFQTTLEIGILYDTRSYSKSTPYFVMNLKYYIMLKSYMLPPLSYK
jgi:hypothetical protein